MASRTRLYTRSRPPRTHETENTSKMINAVIVDIDHNDLLINDSNIQMKVFSKDEIDVCVDYITSELTNLYLFISSDVGNTLIPFIHNFPQIKSIYILNKYENYQKYSYATQRIQGIFHDINRMAKQFQVDITKSEHTYLSEDKTFQNIDPQNAETYWYRFFSMVIECIRPTYIAKDEFTTFCREVFRNKNRILNQIEEFEKDYRSDRAIRWYTDNRNEFLGGFLNKTILTPNNFSNLFKSRLMIIDIINQLKAIQLELHDSIAYPVLVYCGMMMRANEIQELKSAVGNLIMFKQFFSTTIDREFAFMFAHCLGADSLQGVLFTIEIDSFNVNNKRVPFSYIGHCSAVQEEMEVLFSMYSTFRIKSVELGEKNVCYVDLEFVDHLLDINFGERSIFSSHADQIFIRHLSIENKQFIAFQLLLDIILRLDQTSYAKAELLEFCRSKYHDKPKQLKEIDDFDRDYQSENAVEWYTKDSFLYRLLNESLRIETIDHIVKMRYYIHDLHNQLAELQKDFVQSLNEKKNITLYRGQTMKRQELDDLKENKDGFISMNSFLSATQNEEVAFMFSGDGQTTELDEVSVIYEMSIDTNIRSTPYAKIKSINPDEQEILFSMGSIFRIRDVEEVIDHAGVFRVKLTMVYIEDQLWNKLIAHLD
jgi:hypothetical protein